MRLSSIERMEDRLYYSATNKQTNNQRQVNLTICLHTQYSIQELVVVIRKKVLFELQRGRTQSIVSV